MGAAWSSEPFETQCVVMCDSNDTKGKLQMALAQLPEYSGFSIALQSTLKPTELTNACDVDYTYTNASTGYAQRDQRRVTFSGAGCAPVVGTTRSGLMYVKQRVTKEGVYAYYRELANYNQRWNAGGWQADGATYDPPLPSWGDPVFARNVGLYNDNLKRVIGTGGVFARNTWNDANFQTNFQKYIAPTPGAPTPPEMSDVLLDEPDQIVGQTAPPTFQDIIGGGDENTGSANGLANTAASTKNLNTYETLIAGHIARAGPDYDPPKEGDSYETLLIKFNKAYDIVAGKRTGSMNMNSANENRSAFYRRFMGRGLDLAFPIPEPQVPLTRPVEGVMEYNYRPYNFNDRQRELIEYCPVEAGKADMGRLKVNFCAALGFHENITLEDGAKKRCGTGDCCIPLAPLPAYEEPKPGPPRPKKPSVALPPGYERLDPYAPESIANDSGTGGTYFGDSVLPDSSMQRRPPPPRKTASACSGPKEYVIPGKRYYVESAPTRAQNAKKRLEYVMSKPVDSCSKNPAGSAEGFVAFQHAAQLKGSQQEENSKKLASLRGMY